MTARATGRAARGVFVFLLAAAVLVVATCVALGPTMVPPTPGAIEPPRASGSSAEATRPRTTVSVPTIAQDPVRLEVSGLDGRPVAGAVAHRAVRLAAERRSPWDSLAHGSHAFATAPLATTDAEGRAEIATEGDAPLPLRVSARGYEPALISATRGTNVVRLTRGFRIFGKVVDEAGSAVAGAVVAVVSLQRGLDDVAEGKSRFTKCGADGQFEADAVSHGDYILFAGREPPLAGQAASVRVIADVELTLVVPAADFTFRGRVVTTDDEAPIAGARVEAQLVGSHGSFTRTAATGGDGAFVLDRVESSFVHRVRVRADGYTESERRWGAGSSESPPRTGDANGIVLRLRRAASIGGRVTTNGAAAAGVEVSVWERRTDAPGWTRTVAITDAEGRYEATGIEPGLCVVDVDAAGFVRVDAPPSSYRGGATRADRSWGRSVVEVRPGVATEHDLELRAVPQSIVTVTSHDGRPVVGATVKPSSGASDLAAPEPTNAVGETVVDMRGEPSRSFAVGAPGFQRLVVTLPAAPRNTVALPSGLTVTGRVEVNGRPGSNAAVRALPPYVMDYEVASRWEIGGSVVREAVADADGRFEIRGVPVPGFVVAAMGDDGVAGFSEVVRPSGGADVPDVVVRVASARVRGVVRDARGARGGTAIRVRERRPTTGVRWAGGVWVENRPGGSGVPAVAWSGADGAFEFVVPADVEHVVWADDGATRSAPVSVPAIAVGEVRDVVLNLTADAGIHGVVLTADGVAAPGVHVRLVKRPISAEDAIAQHSTRAGSDGVFRFPGLEGEWYLRIVQDGGELLGWSMKVIGPSESAVRVQLPRRREARGVVFDGEGVPCRAASVVATDATSGILTTATTGSDGTFVISIPAGPDVTLSASAGVARTELAISPSPTDLGHLELRLPRARPMRVRVVNSIGAAIVGETIIYKLPGLQSAFVLGTVVTGPGGRGETAPLPAGAYDFKWARRAEGRREPQVTTVRWDLAADEVEVRFGD